MQPQKTPPNLCQDLIQLYDDLCEFNDYCAFLCDAMPGLLTDEYEIEGHTVRGASRYLFELKGKAESLKADLGVVQRRACGREECE